MSSSLSSRLFAAVLERIEREKAERLKHEWEAKRAELDAEESRQRADAALLNQKRKDFEDRERQEREELTDLERRAKEAGERSEEERRIDTAAGRASVFRGSSAADVKERLIHEGVPEALAQDIVRLRTLDQTLENRGGMRARFNERDDPTKQGNPEYFLGIEGAVGGAGTRAPGTNGEGVENQYFRQENTNQLYTGVPEAVGGLAQQPTLYEAASKDREDGVRKGLGIGEVSRGYQ